jgi:hypothetical protein
MDADKWREISCLYHAALEPRSMSGAPSWKLSAAEPGGFIRYSASAQVDETE